MASLTLGIVGTVAGGMVGGPFGAQIGGMIGASLGGMIDNQLFPSKNEGPRLGDLTIQTSTLGNPIPLLFGPENRITGNVIWSTGLKETKHKQKSGGKGGPSVSTTTYTYSTSFAVALCEGEIEGIRKIWANNKLIYDASAASGTLSDPPDAIDAKLWTDMRVYPGTFTQNPDPTIEAHDGIGEVQAFRGTAYVMFTDFQLADYGNRLPNLEFLVEKDAVISVAEVLSIIVSRCGLDPNKVSTSSIDGEVRGYTIAQLSSGTAALQPLALVFNFDSAQVAGALRFTPRGNGPSGIVLTEHLGGHEGTDDRPQPLNWTRTLETLMPREASLQFRDPNRDYQVNSQAARRQAGSAENNLSTNVPIVIDVETAARLADRMLWEAWTGRQTAQASTDDRWIGIEAGKVYLFETPAGLEPLRLKRRTRGANGVIDLELARDRGEVYRSTAAGINSDIPVQVVNVPGPTTLFLFDSPILADADDDTGFYYMVDGQTTGWRGADVIRSIDGGLSYDEVAPQGFQGVLGVIDELAAGVTDVFDLVNVIRVTLDDPTDELETLTEDDVLAGKNAAWIGPADGSPGEVLQYVTATLVAPGVYDLSTLLRGRLGTEWAVADHGTGDRFVQLDGGGLARADFGAADWTNSNDYKAVTLLTTEADAAVVPFTNTGEGKRPLSPVNIVGDNTGADLIITWSRRSRLRQVGLAGPLPLGESVEAYEIDFFDGTGGPYLRTLTSSTPDVTYTAAEQVIDGIAPGDTVEVEVYQMSDVAGRGRPGIAELLA